MFHYLLYKTTNLTNGKIYIGIHKTKNKDDGYIGSGKLLLQSVKKYGIENFQTEILLDCLSLKDLLRLEAEIVNEDFIQRDDTYNLKKGGIGSWDYINDNKKEFLKKVSFSLKKKWEDENYKKIQSDLFRNRIRKMIEEGKFNPKTFLGKKHTEETKKKISEANKKMIGERNSQYGTMWITNGIDNKKIKKDELLPEGYKKGRIIKLYQTPDA